MHYPNADVNSKVKRLEIPWHIQNERKDKRDTENKRPSNTNNMKTSVDIHAGDLVEQTVAAIKHVHVSTRKTKYCILNVTFKTTHVFDIEVRID